MIMMTMMIMIVMLCLMVMIKTTTEHNNENYVMKEARTTIMFDKDKTVWHRFSLAAIRIELARKPISKAARDNRHLQKMRCSGFTE